MEPRTLQTLDMETHVWQALPQRKRKMQVQIHVGTGVILLFPQSERHVALVILRAVHASTGQEFLKEAIKGIEEDLKPKIEYYMN